MQKVLLSLSPLIRKNFNRTHGCSLVAFETPVLPKLVEELWLLLNEMDLSQLYFDRWS